MTNNQKEEIFSNKFIQNFLENESKVALNNYKFAEIASSLAYYLKSFSNINKLIDYQDISIMIWRASQPSGLGIPENLQVCDKYNIAFCGDWFDLEGFGRIEGAILSALKLSFKISSLY